MCLTATGASTSSPSSPLLPSSLAPSAELQRHAGQSRRRSLAPPPPTAAAITIAV